MAEWSLSQDGFRALFEGARADIRGSVSETGHSLPAYEDAVRGRDLSLERVNRDVSAVAGPDGRMIACRRGCNHCCHQLVAAAPLEVLIIARRVAAWPAERREDLVRRLEAIACIPATEEERTSRKLPCPLLENGECAVYDRRPGNCRALLSYSEDACSNGLDTSTARHGDGDLVPSPDLPYLVTSACSMGLDAGQIERGLDTERIDLVMGLLMALTDPGVREAWLKGEEVFAPARLPMPIANRELIAAALRKLALDD